MSMIYSLVFLHFCTFALCLSNFVFISPIHCSFILPHPEFRSASFSLSVLFISLSLLLALFHAQYILTARYCVCLLLNVFTLDFVAFVAYLSTFVLCMSHLLQIQSTSSRVFIRQFVFLRHSVPYTENNCDILSYTKIYFYFMFSIYFTLSLYLVSIFVLHYVCK